MITVTQAKPFEVIAELLAQTQSVYIIGCGTCATMLHTGGKTEVLAMKEKLEAAGKKVSGWMVIPTACDLITREALTEEAPAIGEADAILVLSCAFGVQTVSAFASKPAYGGLDTLFIGKEDGSGEYIEVCQQCGDCVIGQTAGICPLTRCAKSLFNGPCGGSVKGRCETDPETPCAWQMIIDRLSAWGQLDKLEDIIPAKDWSKSISGGPRRFKVGSATEKPSEKAPTGK
jgi:hypothetical protein